MAVLKFVSSGRALKLVNSHMSFMNCLLLTGKIKGLEKKATEYESFCCNTIKTCCLIF